jgi:hypothetical protein
MQLKVFSPETTPLTSLKELGKQQDLPALEQYPPPPPSLGMTSLNLHMAGWGQDLNHPN